MKDQAATRLAAAQAKLFHKKNQAQVKANHVAQESIITSKIVRCDQDSDSPGAQQCVNYAPKLSALSKSSHASVEQSALCTGKQKLTLRDAKTHPSQRCPSKQSKSKCSFKSSWITALLKSKNLSRNGAKKE